MCVILCVNLFLPSPTLSVFPRDYQSIPRLDTYDGEHLDEGEYDGMDPEARVAAEKAMRKRDRQVSHNNHFHNLERARVCGTGENAKQW